MSKVSVLIDVTVEIEPPTHITRWASTQEERAKKIQEWAKEFEDFIRDHRSMDPSPLFVKRVMQEQCSHCGREWEEDADGPLCCSPAQEEHDTAKLAKAAA